MNYLGIASEEALYQRTFLSLFCDWEREKQSLFYTVHINHYQNTQLLD